MSGALKQIRSRMVAACEEAARAHEQAAKMLRQRAMSVEDDDFVMNHLAAHLYNKASYVVDDALRAVQVTSEEWLRAVAIDRESAQRASAPEGSTP